MNKKDILILLSSTLSLPEGISALTDKEIERFINYLKQQNIDLEELDNKTEEQLRLLLKLGDSENATIFIQRISKLLNRKAAIAFDLVELKKWEINILTKYDSSYPNAFSSTQESPILLYYVGNLSLLDNFKLGIVAFNKPVIENERQKLIDSYLRKAGPNRGAIIINSNDNLDYYLTKLVEISDLKLIIYVSSSLVKLIKDNLIGKLIRDNKLLLVTSLNPYIRNSRLNVIKTNKEIFKLVDSLLVASMDEKLVLNDLPTNSFVWNKLLIKNGSRLLNFKQVDQGDEVVFSNVKELGNVQLDLFDYFPQ